MTTPFSKCLFKNIKDFVPDFHNYEHKFCVKDRKHNCDLDLTLIEQTYKHFFLCDDKTYKIYRMKIPRHERHSFARLDEIIDEYRYFDELEDEMDIFADEFYDELDDIGELEDVNVRLSFVEYCALFPRLVMGKKTAKKHNLDMNSTDCCICAEDIKSRQHISITKCNHVFHMKCLRTWLIEKCQKPTCPMCRTDVRSE